MLIDKTIITKLNVDDPIMFSADTENNVKRELADKYVGKCHNGCLILEIGQINQISDCDVELRQNYTNGTIGVSFVAKGLICVKDEIINNCVVIKRDDKGVVLCKADNVSIYMKNHKITQTLQPNQIISVVIQNAMYQMYADTIVASSVLFTPNSFNYNIYYSDDTLSQEELEQLKPLMDQLETEKELSNKAKNHNPKGWQYFRDLLYAHSKPSKVPKSKLDIYDLIKKGSTKLPIGIDTYAYYDELLIVEHKQPGLVYPCHTIISTLIYALINRMQTLRFHVESYDTKKLMDGHKNLWSIYQSDKKK